jgi:uncharacterized GH25 family protein
MSTFVRIRIVAAIAVIALAPSIVCAEEFILKPFSTTVEAGERFSVAVLSARIFMRSHKLEAAKDVRIELCTESERGPPVPLSPNHIALTIDARVTAPSSRTFIVCATRLAQISSSTPNGNQESTKNTPGANNSRKIEQFAKTLINLSVGDDGYKTVVGDRLEIVPVTNPAAAKVGDEITFKVLFEGQPLSTPIFATYDRFSENEATYAYYTEAADDGTAKVQITHPGLWMVRVETKVPEKAEDHDTYLARAVLVFRVR